jgi:hypothetical protein
VDIWFKNKIAQAKRMADQTEVAAVEATDVQGQDVWSISVTAITNQNEPLPTNMGFTGNGNGEWIH